MAIVGCVSVALAWVGFIEMCAQFLDGDDAGVGGITAGIAGIVGLIFWLGMVAMQ